MRSVGETEGFSLEKERARERDGGVRVSRKEIDREKDRTKEMGRVKGRVGRGEGRDKEKVRERGRWLFQQWETSTGSVLGEQWAGLGCLVCLLIECLICVSGYFLDLKINDPFTPPWSEAEAS